MNFNFNKDINESLSFSEYENIRQYYVNTNAIASIKRLDKKYYSYYIRLLSKLKKNIHI